MKRILFVVIILLTSFVSFSQQAKGYLLVDEKKQEKHFVKQGSEIVVSTNVDNYKTNLDSVSNNNVYTSKGVFPFDDIIYLKDKDDYKSKQWKNIFWKTLLLSFLLVALGYGLVSVITITFVLTISGFLGFVLLIPIFIIWMIAVGRRKIWFKKR